MSFVRFGDVVLVNVHNNGVTEARILSDGHTDTAAVALPPASASTAWPQSTERFVLAPPGEHAAARRLAKLREAEAAARAPRDDSGETTGAVGPPVSTAELHLAQMAAATEAAGNRAMETSMRGQMVNYGSVIALRQQASQRLLALRLGGPSVVERENVAVELASESAASVWAVRPRFRVRTEGEGVPYSDTFMLVSAKFGIGVHVSTRPFPADLLPSPWVDLKIARDVNGAVDASALQLTCFASHDTNKEMVHGGAAVRIFHAESDGYLAADLDGVVSSSAASRVKLDAVWIVERLDGKLGGHVAWDEPVRLCHLQSNGHLVAAKGGLVRVDHNVADDNARARFLLSPSGVPTSLEYAPMRSAVIVTSAAKSTPRTLRVQSASTAGAAAPGLVPDAELELAAGDESPSATASQPDVIVGEGRADGDAVRFLDVEENVVRDMRFVLSSVAQLKCLADVLAEMKGDSVPIKVLDMTSHIIAGMVRFLTDSEHAEPLRIVDLPLPNRQVYVFESGLVAPMMRIAGMLDAKRHRRLLAEIFALLKTSFLNNREGELSMIEWIDTIIEYVGKMVGAEHCLARLLDNNAELIARVGKETIQTFLRALKASRSSDCLDFLIALCSCQGKAIESQQNRLSRLVIGDEKMASAVLWSFQLEGVGPAARILVSAPGLEKPVWQQIEDAAQSSQATAAYLAAQVRFVAELCFDRHYVAIHLVEPKFPLDLVLHAVHSERIPLAVRAAFVRLLATLHVNRGERLVRRVPARARVIASSSTTTTRGNPVLVDDVRKQDEFDGLIDTCHGILESCRQHQVLSDIDHNKFILEVLLVMRMLVDFGHYGTMDKMQRLVRVVCPLLDGRQDVQSRNDPTPAPPSVRYRVTAETLPVMDCKRQMLSILLRVSNTRLEYRTGQVLDIVRDATQRNRTPNGADLLGRFDNLFRPKTARDDPELDFDLLTPNVPFVPLLKDLVLYEYSPLVDRALLLLMRQFLDRDETVDNVCSLQVLVPTRSAVLKTGQHEIAHMRLLLETFELWGEKEDERLAAFDSLVNSMHMLHFLCLDHSALCAQDGAADEEHLRELFANTPSDDWRAGISPLPEHQALMASAGAHRVIVDVLRARARHDAEAPVLAALRALTAFCDGHASNKSRVHSHLDLLLEVANEHPAATFELLAVVFAQSPRFAASFSRDQVDACFAILLDKKGPYVLRFFQVLVDGALRESSGEPTARRVLELFVSAKHRGEVLDPFITSQGKGEMAEYHQELIGMLHALVSGRNLMCEALVQSLLEPSELIGDIENEDLPAAMRVRSTHLFIQTFLDTVRLQTNSLVDETTLSFFAHVADDAASRAEAAAASKSGSDAGIFFERAVVPLLRHVVDTVIGMGLVPEGDSSTASAVMGVTREIVVRNERKPVSKFQEHMRDSLTRLFRVLSTARLASFDELRLLAIAARDRLGMAVGDLAATPDKADGVPSLKAIDTTSDDEPALVAFDALRVALHEDVATRRAEHMTGLALMGKALLNPASDGGEVGLLNLLTHIVAYLRENLAAVPSKVVRNIFGVVASMVRTVKTDSHGDVSLQETLIETGIVSLVIDVVSSDAIGEATTVAAFRCGNALLDECVDVQDAFAEDLQARPDASFFANLEQYLVDMRSAVKRNDAADEDNEETSSAGYDDGEALVRELLVFIENLVDGHHEANQTLMREQANVLDNINVLDSIISLWISLEKRITNALVELGSQALRSLSECMQGPCEPNQLAIASSRFLDSANNVVRKTYDGQLTEENESRLKCRVLFLIQSLVEGRTDDDVHRRIIATLDVKSTRMRLISVYERAVDAAAKAGWGTAPPTVHMSSTGDVDLLEEGFELFTVVQILADADPSLRLRFVPGSDVLEDELKLEFDDETKSSDVRQRELDELMARYTAAYTYYSQAMAHVEIQTPAKLERVYFRVPAACTHLTEVTKDRIKWSVNRDTASDKIQSFFDLIDQMVQEMIYKERLSKYALLGFASRNASRLMNISMVLALAINVLLLVDTAAFEGSGSSSVSGAIGELPIEDFVFILGIVVVVVGPIVALVYAINFAPLIVDRYWDAGAIALRRAESVAADRTMEASSSMAPLHKLWAKSSIVRDLVRGDRTQYERSTSPGFAAHVVHAIWSTWYLFHDPMLVYYTLYTIFGLLGVLVSPVFFSFHLLEICVRSAAIKRVLRAVSHRAPTLVMTALLAFVLIYIFTVAGYFLMQDAYVTDEGEKTCETMWRCLVVTLNQGLRNGGGMGDYLQSEATTSNAFLPRSAYDLFFFIVINVILLNVVFGQIIDSFADLREVAAAKAHDMASTCFVCGLTRDTLDLTREGFLGHITSDHNMWHLLYFIAMVQWKDAADYDGIEAHVAQGLATRNYSFVPLQTCLSLKEKEEEEEEREESEEQKVTDALDAIRSTTVRSVERMSELEAQVARLTKLVEKTMRGR